MPPPPAPPPPHGPLTVLIVGAGIGGLSAAVALRQAGHNVELFEQSKFANEVGAAISLAPNASRVMASYGYSEERVGGVPCQFMEIRAPDGTVLHSEDQSSVPEVYGAPWYLCHRVDLHNELKHLALDPDASPGPVCKLHLAHTVIGLDADKGTLRIRGPWGPVVAHGDLIIGADGVHSVVRSTLFPALTPPPPTGISAFRVTLPTDKLLSSSTLASYAPTPAHSCLRIVVGRDKRIIMYPCRRNELLNLVCVHPGSLHPTAPSPSPSTSPASGWDSTSTVSVLREIYADFGPTFAELFALLSDADVKLWSLISHPPLQTWISGCVALLGDACHPMLPFQGQGGGQAIEDGAALGVLFPLGTRPEEVPSRLAIYEHVRKGRAEAIQMFSARFEGASTLTAAQAFTFGHDVLSYAKQSMTAVYTPPVPVPPPQKSMEVPLRVPSRAPSPSPIPSPR